MRQSLRLTISSVTAVVVALNLLAALFVVWGERALADTRQWVAHTYTVLHEIDGLLADVARRSAATRGYLMGGGEVLLAQSRERNAAIDAHLQELRRQTADNPQQQEYLDGLTKLLAESGANWKIEVESPDRPAAIARSIARESVEVGQETRDLLDRMAAEERSLLNRRWNSEGRAAERYTTYAVLMTLLAIASMIGALWVALQQLAARAKAEHEVQGQSALLRATVEHLGKAVAVFDRKHRLLMWNQHFAELRLTPAHRILTGATIQEVAPEDAARITAGGTYSRPAPGDVMLEIQCASMPDGGVLVTWNDISARTRVEKMKNEFISTVSHELRTPLTSIIGSLGLVRGGVTGELPEEAEALLEIAHRNGERLVRLINDILDIEKIESGRMDFTFQTCDLMGIVRSSVEANAGYAERFQVKAVVTSTVEDAPVTVDRARLEQVLANLLSNAAKFSPTGGQVEVSVERLEGRFRVSVRDHGEGVPVSFQHQLFEKFAQADSSNTRAKGGTGLGLSISRAIMERLGGSIGYSSTPGEGSTFFIELPEAVRPQKPVSSGSGPRVLVVEDDEETAHSLARLLSRAGFACDIAASGPDALARLATTSYDLMTLDVLLPGEDGIALLRRIRTLPAGQKLPAIVISAVGAPAPTGLDRTALGIRAWLTKPLEPRALEEAALGAIRPTADPLAS